MISCGLLIAAALAEPSTRALAQSDDEILEATRSIIKADRQAVVSESMQLSEAEAKSFWPIDHQYRTEMDTVGDGVKHLVLEVTAIDTARRTATLKFEDGTTRTLPVRRDVDLAGRKVGDKAVFRVTESLAISVKKL